MPDLNFCPSIFSMNLGEFNKLHPLHPPLRPSSNTDECRQLGESDGVRTIVGPVVSAPDADRNVPEQKGDPGCHLWVFDSSSIPFICERAPVADSLKSGEVKHTNLTCGGDASCGGELWVDPADENRI